MGTREGEEDESGVGKEGRPVKMNRRSCKNVKIDDPGEGERERSASEEERAKISQVRRWFEFVETQEPCV